jgi:hypothetical protein
LRSVLQHGFLVKANETGEKLAKFYACFCGMRILIVNDQLIDFRLGGRGLLLNYLGIRESYSNSKAYGQF